MKRTIVFGSLLGVAALAVGGCETELEVGDPAAEAAGATRWEGNAPDCPGAVPANGDPCSVAEGQICAYRDADPENPGYELYQACGCWLASGGRTLFYCYDESGGPPCPEAEPVTGSDCFGMRGTECRYPERTVCRCPGGDEEPALWSCLDHDTSRGADDPIGVDPSKPISEFSDEERAAWCAWYRTAENGPGSPDTRLLAVDENGYTIGTGCSGGEGMVCAGTVPRLSASQCEANLELSTCPAPVAELTDCVRTFLNMCWPSPRGCAPYLDRSGCDGTMVVANTEPTAERPWGQAMFCDVRVR